MIFKVTLSPVARGDLNRIDNILAERSLEVAERGAAAIRKAVVSLARMPNRGRPAVGAFRELIVPFGQGSYIVRYRVAAAEVLVTRIFHSLEDRPLA